MSREMRETHLNWLGSIPKDWQLRAVKNFYPHMTTGFTPPSKQEELYDQDGDIWVNISDLNGTYVADSKKHISHDYAISRHKNELTPKGSLMYAFKLSVGQVAFASCDLYTNEAIASFHPDENVYLDFLRYSSSLIVNNAEKNIYGADLLNQDRIRNALIVYPPVLEQHQIVSFLDRKCSAIDTAIDKTKKSIEKLEEYKKAVITKAVTKGLDLNTKMKDSGIEWIGKIPEDWNILRGKFIFKKLSRSVKETDDVITCFRDGEVTLRKNRREEGFTFSDKEIGYQGIEPGDLVVHGMDGFAGSIGISDSRGKATPVLNVLDSTQNKKYYMYYLRSMAYGDVFNAIATGIRVRSCNLNWNKLAELSYPVPSKETQKTIVDYIDNKLAKTDALIAKKREAISKWEEYKKSLIYYAVTGKIDCRGENL